MTIAEQELNIFNISNYQLLSCWKNKKKNQLNSTGRKGGPCPTPCRYTFCNPLIHFYNSNVDLGDDVVCFYLSEVEVVPVIQGRLWYLQMVMNQ